MKPTGSDLRREVLDDVARCVLSDRQNTYGDAEDNFQHIAEIASVVLGNKLTEPLTAADVAAFSACIKLARIRSSPEHLDNWVDLAGYAVCGAGIVKRCELESVECCGGFECRSDESMGTGAGATTSSESSPSASPRGVGVRSTP